MIDEGTRKPYAFERVGDGRAYRDPADARTARDVFLSRVGVEGTAVALVQADHELWDLLREHATEFALNIEWYARAVQDRSERERDKQAATAFLIIAGIVVAAGLPWLLDKSPSSASIWIASAGAIAGTFLSGAKTLAQATDARSELAGFWEASSNLKEALFTFENRWRRKVVVAGVVAPDFKDAVQEQLRLARAETRKERAEFFKNLRSAADTIGGAEQVLAQLRDKVTPAVGAARDSTAADAKKREAEAATLLEAARKKVLTTSATEAGAKAKLANAEASRDAAAVKTARTALDTAAAEAAAARAELDVYLRLTGTLR